MVFVDNISHFFETVLCTVANLQKCDLLLIYTLKNIPIIQDDYSETFNSFQRLILSMHCMFRAYSHRVSVSIYAFDITKRWV